MPREESSDEFADGDSEEEEEEEESSASFESEEDEDVAIDDDDDDETFHEKKAPIRKSQKASTQSSTTTGKRKSQATPANGRASRAKTAATSPPTPRRTATSATSRTGISKPEGSGKGKGKAVEDVPCLSNPSSQTLSSTPGEEIPATPSPTTPSPAASGKISTPIERRSSPSSAAASATASGPGTGASKSIEAKVAGGSGSGAKTPKATISDYMLKANRPYSCINVFDNLHKKIPKAMVQKILDELVGSGTCKVQEYGKSKIYYANQDALPNGAGEASDAKLQKLDQDAKELTARAEIATTQAREAQARVQSLSSQPSDTALQEELAATEEELKQLEERVGVIKGQGHSAVAGGLKKAKTEFNKYRTMWVTRKRNAMEVIDMIADGMEKKPSQIMEIIELEVDEESLPPKM